jgi:light-regulated signal transduction histidine kinase (bacteriophytochrome)
MSTQLEEKLRMLERSNLALERLACDASHDLAEPLRVMSKLAERLAATSNGSLDEESRRLLTGIVDGVDRMRMLISDLLADSRMCAEPSPREPVDCASMLRQVIDLLDDSIAELGATVTYERMPTVHAHRTQLAQVFQNLISNALRFARDGMPVTIHISARYAAGAWRFSVEDNGIGIDADQTERVFERFCRLNSRDAFAGTGLGLSICRRIVAHHGGRIWATAAPAGGSIFSFTIPDAVTNGDSPNGTADRDGHRYSTRPLRIASATAAARSDTPSF